MAIELHRAFGLSERDFFVRLSNRNLWAGFLRERNGPEDRLTEFLAIIDKLERDPEELTKAKLVPFGLGLQEIRDFMQTPPPSIPSSNHFCENCAGADLKGSLKWT